MSNHRYATVLDYATFGHSIVSAHRIPNSGLSLTGFTVDVNPEFWSRIDALEGAYDRKIVKTTDNELVNMYVGK